MTLIANFFAGVFLCNCIPHLASGLRGELFPSPFAKPPGVGNSHPVMNVIWGMINVVSGGLLLHYAPVTVGPTLSFLAAIGGALVGGCLIANYFYRLRRTNQD